MTLKPLTPTELERLATRRDRNARKLDPEQVVAMLRERIAGTSVKDLARKYGVTRASVYARIQSALAKRDEGKAR